MVVGGLICEYNPFHNGHRYMLSKMRDDGTEAIVACMSGSFTQRGEPAVFDKYTRTKAALQNGVDLVIELPVAFACAGAERFALGGVYLLNAAGCVQRLYFGSESGDTSLLHNTAAALTDSDTVSLTVSYAKDGMTYAAAREKAVRKLFGSAAAGVLKTPNDILGTEYCKALIALQSTIQPCAISRKSVAHDSSTPDDIFASASFLRERIYSGQNISHYVPQKTWELYEPAVNFVPHGGRLKKTEQAILYRLRMMSERELAALPDISEGLESRLYAAVHHENTVEDVLRYAKCKRYTMARLRRCLIHALLGLTKADTEIMPQYIRVLGFTDKGQAILRECKKNASLPIITKYAQTYVLSDNAKQQFALEGRCDDIYALSGNTVLPCGSNYTSKVIRENSESLILKNKNIHAIMRL